MTRVVIVSSGCRGSSGKRSKGEVESQSQLSLIALMMATIKKSMVHCRMNFREDEVMSAVQKMDISWPTEVRHVAHVTFDRFNGFLGLPVEFELEVPCRAPSASVSVFGVSAESMQCSFDSKGNSVPTILLLMQERLYLQGGLKAEGIFRINPENSQEKELRKQLNKGIVPDDIDVHCLAGLIKAWFRELPEGILDSLSPGQVLQRETEEDCVELIKLLPPTQYALLNWAIDLMADVVEEEDANKMNARNIAMVFAPNMTQLSDPLTSLMHAVQVMNLLQTLIFRTLRERDEEAAAVENYSSFSSSPSSGGYEDATSEPRESSSVDDHDNDVRVELKKHTADDVQVTCSDISVDEDENIEGIEEFVELRAQSSDDINDEYEAVEVIDEFVELRGETSDDVHVNKSHANVDEDEHVEEIEKVVLIEEFVELRGQTSDDVLGNNSHNNADADEDEHVEEIEECFLKQLELEWKEESGDVIGEIISPCVSSGDQLSSSEFIAGGSSPSNSDSKEVSTCNTINEVESIEILHIDAATNANLLTATKHGKQVEMDMMAQVV